MEKKKCFNFWVSYFFFKETERLTFLPKGFEQVVVSVVIVLLAGGSCYCLGTHLRKKNCSRECWCYKTRFVVRFLGNCGSGSVRFVLQTVRARFVYIWFQNLGSYRFTGLLVIGYVRFGASPSVEPINKPLFVAGFS